MKLSHFGSSFTEYRNLSYNHSSQNTGRFKKTELHTEAKDMLTTLALSCVAVARWGFLAFALFFVAVGFLLALVVCGVLSCGVALLSALVLFGLVFCLFPLGVVMQSLGSLSIGPQNPFLLT